MRGGLTRTVCMVSIVQLEENKEPLVRRYKMRNTGTMAEQLAHKQTAKIKATIKSSITNAQLKYRKISLLQRS